MSLWKKLMGRRDAAAVHGAEEADVETPAERRVAAEGVEGLGADELDVRFGGADPNKLVDDEFKP